MQREVEKKRLGMKMSEWEVRGWLSEDETAHFKLMARSEVLGKIYGSG
jgi:hypothetical protein